MKKLIMALALLGCWQASAQEVRLAADQLTDVARSTFDDPQLVLSNRTAAGFGGLRSTFVSPKSGPVGVMTAVYESHDAAKRAFSRLSPSSPMVILSNVGDQHFFSAGDLVILRGVNVFAIGRRGDPPEATLESARRLIESWDRTESLDALPRSTVVEVVEINQESRQQYEIVVDLGTDPTKFVLPESAELLANHLVRMSFRVHPSDQEPTVRITHNSSFVLEVPLGDHPPSPARPVFR